MAKSRASTLTPFVRSDAQGEILVETLGRPGDETTLTELAERTGVGLTTVHREVERLVAAQVLQERRQGNNRLVSANTAHPLYHLMGELVLASHGPLPVLRELVSNVESITEAYIYGSWAARKHGKPGHFPHDIDVLAVGQPQLDEILHIEREAREILRREINIRRVSTNTWQHWQNDPFLTTVRSRPLVQLKGGTDGAT